MPELALSPDVSLHYETWGSPESPPVVLLHGFTSDLRMWAPQARELSDDFFVVAPDLRGHGLSASPDDPDAYSIETYAGDVRALLHELEIDRCALVGCSFGGMIALEFATRWPDRLACLVVSDSSPACSSERYDDAFRQREERMREAEDLVRRAGTAALARHAAAGITDPFLAGGLRRRYANMSAEGYLGAARARRERPNLIPLLRERLTMPVLLCTGDEDPAAAGTRVMAEELPLARVVTFRNTGHGVPALRPEAFTRVLLQFFRDVEEGNPVGGHRSA